MKILSVNKFYWKKGGSETVFFGEKSLLEQHGHTVVPFAMQHPYNFPSDYAKYFVSESDYEQGGLKNKVKMAINIIYSFEARRKIEKLLDVYQPNIAHFHIFQHQISPSVFTPLKTKNIPLILTLHDLKPICPIYLNYTKNNVCEKCYGQHFYYCTLNKCTKNSYAKSLINTLEMYLHYALGFYQNVDKYIAVSQFYRNKMLDNGFSEQQVVYLPNFIDIKNYPLSFENDGSILYFGRLSEEKGVDTLLRAAKYCPDLNFIIAGTGSHENQLKQEAELLSNVKFVGFQSGEALLSLISQSLCTVLPSKWYENCPMSILESLAMGKPVIGSHIGGIPELIDEGKDGFTFEVGNAEDLANKIVALKNYTEQQRKEVALYARNKIEQRFSPEQHYERLIQIYGEVM